MIARDLQDPGIGFTTITRVQVSPDLHHARGYYTTLGDPAARKTTGRALERAASFMRRQIGQRLRLRRAPELEFVFDESIAHQDRVAQLLQELHEKDAATEPSSEADSSGSSTFTDDEPTE
jgi:ribosome-binding factor A